MYVSTANRSRCTQMLKRQSGGAVANSMSGSDSEGLSIGAKTGLVLGLLWAEQDTGTDP